jgi:vitamin-K-epoxide reductase (warfarin-sensitive)
MTLGLPRAASVVKKEAHLFLPLVYGRGNNPSFIVMGRSSLTTVSFIGLALSLYAIYVEIKKTSDDSFDAICDISETMSCSKVFLSEQGKIWSWLGIIPKDSVLDQPNAVYGAAFYVMIIILDSFHSSNKTVNGFLMLLGVAGVALSALLAKILFMDLNDTCLVCLGSYICNIAVFFQVLRRWRSGGINKALSHSSIDDIYRKSKASRARK